MALRALNVLPALCLVLAVGMGSCTLPSSPQEQFPCWGEFMPGSGGGFVKLTLQLLENMPKWKRAQIS